MKVSRTMTRDVICVSPSHSLTNAYELMTEWSIRHLPVVEGRRLVGILSDRDLLLSGIRTARGVGFPPDIVSSIMTPRPLTCRRGASIGEAVGLMLDHKIDCLPVVDMDGDLVGLITSTDLLALLRDRDNDEASLETVPFSLRFVESCAAAAT